VVDLERSVSDADSQLEEQVANSNLLVYQLGFRKRYLAVLVWYSLLCKLCMFFAT